VPKRQLLTLVFGLIASVAFGEIERFGAWICWDHGNLIDGNWYSCEYDNPGHSFSGSIRFEYTPSPEQPHDNYSLTFFLRDDIEIPATPDAITLSWVTDLMEEPIRMLAEDFVLNNGNVTVKSRSLFERITEEMLYSSAAMFRFHIGDASADISIHSYSYSDLKMGLDWMHDLSREPES
jgi:hypothetical protein